MLAIRPEASILGTELSQLVTVRPTVVGRLRNLALPSLSAATAATAGVLGESVPLWVKVSCAVAIARTILSTSAFLIDRPMQVPSTKAMQFYTTPLPAATAT